MNHKRREKMIRRRMGWNAREGLPVPLAKQDWRRSTINALARLFRWIFRRPEIRFELECPYCGLTAKAAISAKPDMEELTRAYLCQSCGQVAWPKGDRRMEISTAVRYAAILE